MNAIAPISQQIWDMKYRLKGPMVSRRRPEPGGYLAKGGPIAGKRRWRRSRRSGKSAFSGALEGSASCPPGRIIAGCRCGTPGDTVQLFCHGRGARRHGRDLRASEGSRPDHAGRAAASATISRHCGPRGTPVKGVGADASGPLTFMDVWDAMCRTIMSAGLIAAAR